MSCSGEVSRISAGGTGQVVRLSCCPSPPPQEQELVRLWKQRRRDLFHTRPLPWGSSAFHSTGGGGMWGPPPPGEDSVVVGPAGPLYPEGGPNPGGTTRQDDSFPGGIFER